jgi:hypothetical protein
MTRNSIRDGGAPSNPEVVVAGDLRLALGTRELRFAERSVVLDPDAVELLRLLMEERGRVVTRTNPDDGDLRIGFHGACRPPRRPGQRAARGCW